MKNWKPIKLEELSEDIQKVYDILNQESDLACVLIGTSYLSELLASTIKIAFIETSVLQKIFDPQRGIIGGFSSRADLAYCLGLISKTNYQDLLKIAEIRNKFAHKHLSLDFGDTTIRKICGELKAWLILILDKKDGKTEELSQEHMRLYTRNQFNMSVVLLGSRIYLNALSKGQEIKS